jgi:hypothetical protein
MNSEDPYVDLKVAHKGMCARDIKGLIYTINHKPGWISLLSIFPVPARCGPTLEAQMDAQSSSAEREDKTISGISYIKKQLSCGIRRLARKVGLHTQFTLS